MTDPEKKTDVSETYSISTPFQQAVASCTGALITSILMTPLDVVKIRLQAQQKSLKSKCFLYCNGLMDHICSCNPADPNFQKAWFQRPGHFNGTLDAFVKISRHEGIFSLWSGLSPTLVLAVPATIVYFVTYEQLRQRLKNYYNRNNGGEINQPFWIPLISGATARMFSTTIVNPVELIRTKMQSKKLSYFEVGEALRLSLRQDGVAGLWTGISSTLLRDVPFSAIYWMHYEAIKSLFGSDVPSFWFTFMAGAASGSIAATITIPFDVVKTHQQIEIGERQLSDHPGQAKTMQHVFRRIYKQYGFKGLYAGLVPRLIKVAPACAIMISTFEYSKVVLVRLAKKNINYDETSTANIRSNISDSSKSATRGTGIGQVGKYEHL